MKLFRAYCTARVQAQLYTLALLALLLGACGAFPPAQPTLTPAPLPQRNRETSTPVATPAAVAATPTAVPLATAVGAPQTPATTTAPATATAVAEARLPLLPGAPPAPATAECPGAAGAATRLPGQRRGINLSTSSPAQLPSLFDAARDLGATWVRVPLAWRDSEPQRGSYNWAVVDQLTSAAEARGLRLLLTISASPDWANTAANRGLPDQPADLAAFLTALVQHTGNKIAAYEIWPAINTAAANGGTVAQPGAYVDTLAAAYSAIKAANRCALVLSGALVPTTLREPAQASDDLAFYRAMLAHKDGIFQQSHDIVALALNTGGQQGGGDWPGERPQLARNFASYATIFHDEMLYNDQGGRQIWVVQAGYRVAGEQAVSSEQQGQYLASLYDLLLTRYPWATALFARGLDHSTPDGADYSLLEANGTPRPGFAMLAKYFAQQHAREAQVPGIAGTNLVQAWSFAPHHFAVGRLVAGPDGAIYSYSGTGYLRAVEANGAPRLALKPGSKDIIDVAIDARQQIYASTDRHTLTAFSPGGVPLWVIDTQGEPRGPLLLSPDGQTLYTATDRRQLYAYATTDGALRWQAALDDQSGGLALGSDGTIYSGDSSGVLRALASDGSPRWQVKTGGALLVPPLVSGANIYAATKAGVLLAYDTSGSPRWQVATNSPPTGLVASNTGTVYLSGSDGRLHAVGADGTLRWSTALSGEALTAPAVLTDGRIAVAGSDQTLRIVAADGVQQGKLNLNAAVATPPLAGRDGALYIALSEPRQAVLAFGNVDLRARYNVP